MVLGNNVDDHKQKVASNFFNKQKIYGIVSVQNDEDQFLGTKLFYAPVCSLLNQSASHSLFQYVSLACLIISLSKYFSICIFVPLIHSLICFYRKFVPYYSLITYL